MENIIGVMVVYIRAISSMESDMDMGYGRIRNRFIKGIIGLIKNRGWGYTYG